MFFLTPCIAVADAARNWQLSFQDPATPIAEGIIRFHTDLMIILVGVCLFVFFMIYRITLRFNVLNADNWGAIGSMPSGNQVHGTVLEIVWTVLPACLLVAVAIPSFALLYSVDELVDAAMTIKVEGHQWYWVYEYGDYALEDGNTSVTFESYQLPDDELKVGQFRQLEVDNRLVMPVNTHIRLIVTATDVLHCWTIPSFGVKMDACPGRLNQAGLFITRPGTFYGQCSEICGINHGFMPIVVDAVEVGAFHEWIADECK